MAGPSSLTDPPAPVVGVVVVGTVEVDVDVDVEVVGLVVLDVVVDVVGLVVLDVVGVVAVEVVVDVVGAVVVEVVVAPLPATPPAGGCWHPLPVPPPSVMLPVHAAATVASVNAPKLRSLAVIEEALWSACPTSERRG